MWTELLKEDHKQYQKLLGGERQTELLVGTTDRKSVGYIALIYKGDQNFRRINQYFFQNDRPSSFNLGSVRDQSWPLNRPPMNPGYKAHFDELGKQVPSLRVSLERCVELLLQPGPKYDPNQEGVVSLGTPHLSISLRSLYASSEQ